MIGKTASQISQLCPPGRNEKGEYFDIWWASMNLVWKNNERGYPYDHWILKEYLPSKDTVWENPDSRNELVTIRQNGGLYFTYLELFKVGDIVNWEDVPNNSLVFDDFASDTEDVNKNWHVFRKIHGMGISIGSKSEGFEECLFDGDWKWSKKTYHSPKVQIMALSISGQESSEELKEISDKFMKDRK